MVMIVYLWKIEIHHHIMLLNKWSTQYISPTDIFPEIARDRQWTMDIYAKQCNNVSFNVMKPSFMWRLHWKHKADSRHAMLIFMSTLSLNVLSLILSTLIPHIANFNNIFYKDFFTGNIVFRHIQNKQDETLMWNLKGT